MKRLNIIMLFISGLLPWFAQAQATQKPVIHARHWLAITGKPLAASAGARIFLQGGNAVDAACAMLAATCTMWDVLSWGGETQALIYNPHTGEVIGINALGVAPSGATPTFYKEKGMSVPSAYGPLAAVTPGTPGGLLTMLAEYGTMSVEEVLAPALEMAEGYPIEAQTANSIERNKALIKDWPYSKKVFLPHLGEEREAPEAGEIFRQEDLKASLLKLIEAEKEALKAGKSRREAIYAAYDRFYSGDLGEEFVRGCQEQGGLITQDDLKNWKVWIEQPLSTTYKGIEVYKLSSWVQGPAMLQALNLVENFEVQSMGYNSDRYIHFLYQVMNLSFADRDFYYGDPYFPPEEPLKGLLSKDYARHRAQLIQWDKNNPDIPPGDPYPFQGSLNPYLDILKNWHTITETPASGGGAAAPDDIHRRTFNSGTTTIQACDAEGWVVSVTPSGGWVPACIAGNTGMGMSQRMQSFVLDETDNPYNVLVPGKRPRATLTPSLALKDGKPFLSFAVQGGDSQDQNLLQFFLNVVEFDMNVQQACEAANFNSFQMRSSFGAHESKPGQLLLRNDVPAWTRSALKEKGYTLQFDERSSGPINAIYFDWEHGSFWGGSSNYGEDYGIGW